MSDSDIRQLYAEAAPVLYASTRVAVEWPCFTEAISLTVPPSREYRTGEIRRGRDRGRE
jgi:hypothetical protein